MCVLVCAKEVISKHIAFNWAQEQKPWGAAHSNINILLFLPIGFACGVCSVAHSPLFPCNLLIELTSLITQFCIGVFK